MTPNPEDREEVARIIDPEAFETVAETAIRIADEMAPAYREHGHEPPAYDDPENIACAEDHFGRRADDRAEALTKADAILSRRSTEVERGGLIQRLREASEMASGVPVIDELLAEAAASLSTSEARVLAMQQALEEARQVWKQEGETFFICEACSHQHDEFLKDCDVWDMMNRALSPEAGNAGKGSSVAESGGTAIEPKSDSRSPSGEG